MKNVIIFITFLIFLLPSHSNPMNEGTEYKCITIAMYRIDGEMKDEMKLPANIKPFYITFRNNVLFAKYKILNAPEMADDNAKLTKTSIENDQGRKFDVSNFVKNRKDGENNINIFKELNVKDSTLMMASISKYTGMTAILQTVSSCKIEK